MFRRRSPRRSEPGPTIDAGALAGSHLAAGDPIGWFDELYRRADRHTGSIPWQEPGPHPYLSDWLAEPVADPPGRRAVVVGCGLGDDAVEVAANGFEVTAFDASAEAVDWARARFPRTTIAWRCLDLLALPEDLVGAFDLVIEVRTVPWLPGVVRDAAMQAIATLPVPGGVVVAVTLLATDAEPAGTPSGPPWAQAPSELAAYRAAGLERVALEHPDPQGHRAMEARVTWQRPAASPPTDVLGDLRRSAAPGASSGLPIVP